MSIFVPRLCCVTPPLMQARCSPLHALDARVGVSANSCQSFLECVSAGCEEGYLSAALGGLKTHAERGALASLPDELARCVSWEEVVVAELGHKRRRITRVLELPPHLAALPLAPPPRPRLAQLAPPAAAAVLHALRLNVARFPRGALLALAALTLARAELPALDAEARSAALLLCFDLREEPPSPPAPDNAEATPQLSRAPAEQRVAAPQALPPPIADVADAADAALLHALASGEGNSAAAAAAALTGLLARLLRHGGRCDCLAALSLHEMPNGATLALCSALPCVPAGYADTATLLRALLLRKLSSLSASAPRTLCDALAAACCAAPGATAEAVCAPLVLDSHASAYAAEALVRTLAAQQGATQHAAALLLRLCDVSGGGGGGSAWGEPAVAVVHALLDARPLLLPPALAAFAAACEAAAAEQTLSKSIRFGKLLLAAVSLLSLQLSAHPTAAQSLRRAIAATRTFMAKTTLAKLDKLLTSS